jgi:hypothetical protein
MKSLSVKLGLILVGLIILGYAEVWGASKFERPSLRGLKGFNVIVEKLNPDLEEDGLIGEQLLTDIELQLRKAGIKVLTREEALKAVSISFLYVYIEAYKGKSNLYCSHISVSFTQGVLLERDPSIRTLARTWEQSTAGRCGESVIKNCIRDGLRDVIDVFINDYLAENPK